MTHSNLRNLLGITAGSVAGIKVGKDSSEKHPVLGGLAGAFVGGVGGLFSADAVNALRKLADAAHSRGEAQPEREPSAVDLAFQELRGVARGWAMASSYFAALTECPAVWDAVSRSDDITRDQLREPVLNNQSALLALCRRELRQIYGEIGLSYEQDASLFEAMVKCRLASLSNA